MMRVEVVGDIGIDTGPCSEGFKLGLGLRHVGREEGEVSDGGRSHLGVTVGWVESLVAER